MNKDAPSLFRMARLPFFTSVLTIRNGIQRTSSEPMPCLQILLRGKRKPPKDRGGNFRRSAAPLFVSIIFLPSQSLFAR